jgi:ribonuclease HI
MDEQPFREPSERLAGPGRHVYVAGAVVLTEPGPAAAGVVVTDERGRVLARRSQYVGHTSRADAEAQALLLGLRLAASGGAEQPVIHLEDGVLLDALHGRAAFPVSVRGLAATLREALAEVPGAHLEQLATSANPAHPVALAPLVDWLPERTRRAEDLQVRVVGSGEYSVESASQPGTSYRVSLGGTDAPRCSCADFQYRGIPCKHLLAVAREAGDLDRLFYADTVPLRP